MRIPIILLVSGALFIACGSDNAKSTTSDLAMSGRPDLSVADDLSSPTLHDAAPSDALDDLPAEVDFAGACGAPCMDPTPLCDPQTKHCVQCLPTNDRCANGLYCASASDGGSNYACVPGCKTNLDCAGDGGPIACCNHQCSDTTADGENCGKCGTSCGNGACCSSACIDTAKDIKNCGACGKACAMGQGTMEACVAGACTVSGCTPPFADCNMNPADGCEANLMTDPANCTKCGNFCNFANAMGSCANGCVLGMCYAGFGDCNKSPNDGCEVAVSQDPKNCGACGNVCVAPANSTGSCNGGVCGVGGCDPGFGDCDGNPQNGCEVNLNIDSLNCGQCAMSCAMVLHGVASCVNAVCVLSSCSAPYADCNHNPNDGCEADLLTDGANCKTCGNVCPPLANATSGCANGACALGACNPGFANCNGLPGDGCEVNTSADKNNCGGCGIVCPINSPACSGGVCTSVVGDILFTTPGMATFTVPQGVTSISAVVIGAGGVAGQSSAGGGGGALAYKNNISRGVD